jgi:hypothetical protein
MHRLAPFSAIAIFALASASVARGADRDPTTAQALFEQARADAAAGKYATACPRFEESFRLDPSVGTLLNMADCAEHLGHVASALAHFTDALVQLPATDDRVSYVKERVAKLKPRVPHLQIDTASAEPVVILRDSVEIGPASRNIPLPVEPGPHVIVVRAAGRKDRELRVDLAEGAEQHVRAEPGDPLPSAAAVATIPVVSSQAGPSPAIPTSGAATSTTGRGALPWLATAVAGAGVAAGAVAGVLALSDASQVKQLCANHTCSNTNDFTNASNTASRGKTEETVSTVGFGVGIAGAALATYLWLRPSSGTERTSTLGGGSHTASGGSVTSAWAAPWGGPTGGGLAVGARF